MAFNLKNRSFLTLKDFTPAEIGFLLKLAADLKAARYAGTEVPQLLGKETALIFEKDSTRTRAGFDAAAFGLLLQLSAGLKAARYAGSQVPGLRAKEIALILERDSTRTRVGLEVAASDQGAHVTYLGPSGPHLGHKESVRDTARV